MISLPASAGPGAAPASGGSATAPRDPKPIAASAPAASPAPAGEAAKPSQPRATLTVPFYSEEFASSPVAKVGSDVITMQELRDSLVSSHEERSGTTRTSAEFLPVLERIIEMRLVVLDARETGIDEAPEIRQEAKAFAEDALISMLRAEVSAGVEADPEEVERLFKERAREWKIRTVLFKVEEDAKGFVKAASAGEKFDVLEKKAIDEKKAIGSGDGQYFPRGQMLPPIETLVSGLEIGAAGGPVAVKEGFAVLRVEDIRYPENPGLRAAAEMESRTRRRTDAVWKFYITLQDKYLKKLDRALLTRIDFHARTPGMPALLKDKRVIASFKDRTEKPITVSDVAAAVQRKFFHGADLAIKEKRVNDHKEKVFDAMLMKRILSKEAKARGIHERHSYKSRVEQNENSLVFGQFVETVIKPSVRVDEADVKAYYEQHKDDFSNPELVTLDSIAFPDAKKAQAALDKLHAGADFAWMKVNGDGIVSEEKQDQELKGRTLTTSSMPPALSKALAAAREGEYRLYSTAGLCYVIKVARHVPAEVRPFEAVKNDIIKELFKKNLLKAVKDWAAKVRQVTDVEVFISRLDY